MELEDLLKFVNDFQLKQGIFQSRNNIYLVMVSIQQSQNPLNFNAKDSSCLNMFGFIQFCLQIGFYNFKTNQSMRPQEFMTNLYTVIQQRLDPWSPLKKTFANFKSTKVIKRNRTVTIREDVEIVPLPPTGE